MMIKEPLQQTRVSDQIEQLLIQKVISLELPPGEMINETELANQFECGRTPLREALQRLISANLVVNIPHRGTFISELKLLDYIQLTESVSILESGMAPLAAEKSTDEDLAALEKNLADTALAVREKKWLKVALLDLDFHMIIAQMTQNKYLAETTLRLHRLISRFLFVSLARGMNFETSIQNHQEILDAFRSHDKEKARDLVYQHLVKAHERIITAI